MTDDRWLAEHREELLHAARAGVGAVRIVRPGTYQQDDHGFTIATEDLQAMVRNFGEPVPIDTWEALPGTDVPVPLIGWVKALSVEAYFDTSTLFARIDLLDGGRKLIAGPRRLAYDVRNPFQGWHLSSAIRQQTRDDITGAPVGASLAGLTLVRRPLLAPTVSGAPEGG